MPELLYMKDYLSLLLIFLYLNVFSQGTDREFDSIFYQIASTSVANPNKSLHLADSIFIHSTSEKRKLKSLMLSAVILEKQDKRVEGIEYALRALKIAEELEEYSSIARIYGFLGTQSRFVGFYDEGKNYIQKGIEVASKMQDKNQVERYVAMANHELAEYAIEEGDYKKALEYLELSMFSYRKIENEAQRNFILAGALALKGRCLLGLKENQQALEAFQEAKNYIQNSGTNNTIYEAVIYHGLGEMHLIQKDLDSAYFYLQEAKGIEKFFGNQSVKEDIYGSLAAFFRERKNPDSLSYYSEQHKSIASANQREKKRMVNAMYNYLQENNENEASSTAISWWLVAGGILLLVGGGLFFVGKNKRKEPSDESNDVGDHIKEVVVNVNERSEVPGLKISRTTEEDLSKKIEEFESAKGFLDNEISFSKLVSLLGTNSKYLNHFLKAKYNKDYNTYINDLRIAYIIKKLETDSVYRQYKISHLAEEGGFSSHSNFSANFKRVTDYSPSEFLEVLKLKKEAELPL